MSKEPLRLALAGLGTVGTGVAQLLQQHSARLTQTCGRSLRVTAAASRTFRDNSLALLPEAAQVANAADLPQRPDVDVVLEAIGGADGVALELAQNTLRAGKTLITANKALLAKHGNALAQLAEQHGGRIAFEAAVAGGVPIIKMLRESAVGDNITRLVCILNGTCNYILSEMEETGRSFDDVLAEAQAKGYAEADPTLDIDGHDAAHKIALAAAVAFRVQVPQNVVTEGIRHITNTDTQALNALGYRIRLLGVAQVHADGSVSCYVRPHAVPINSATGRTIGPFNVITYDCEAAGTLAVRGRGAGRAPTATAMVADLVDVALGGDRPVFGVPFAHLRAAPQRDCATTSSAFYICLPVYDKVGVLATIAQAMAQHNVSVRSLVQHSQAADAPVNVILLTHPTTEQAVDAVLQDLAPLCVGATQRLRLL